MGKIKFLVVVLAVFLVLGMLKNTLVQSALAASLTKATHLPVKIGSTRFSFLNSSIDLKNIRVSNPSGFTDKLLLDAPQVAMDFEPQELFKGKAHFKEVRLNLKEIIVVKNAEGKLNIDAVKPTEAEKTQQKEKAADSTAKKGKGPKLQIDKLYLTIGRVVYKDYSAGGANPAIQQFDINIQDRLYVNIDNPSAIVSLIMFEALTRTTLSRLAGLDLDVFKDGALGALSGGLGLVADGAQTFEETTKNILNIFGN